MTNKNKNPETSTDPAATRAHRDKVKKLGEWTTRRSFDAEGPAPSIVLDLLLPRIEPGDIDVGSRHGTVHGKAARAPRSPESTTAICAGSAGPR